MQRKENSVFKLMAEIRSTRAFLPNKQVSKDKIEQVLGSILNYPTAHNMQPVNIHICQNIKLLRELGANIENRCLEKLPFLKE